ncbi:hypothetical protein [Brevibacillus sp. FIR094]|uniref:hypothetical protein n=1 Tax=Brevibacillus sp. FIR094 TaxID=3134809 RepID=UPI003D223D91
MRQPDIDQFGLIIDAMQKPVYRYHMLGQRQEAIVVKVKVQNDEGLYIAGKLMDGTEEKVVKVYQEDKNRLIEVVAMNPILTKKELLAIAENLK